MPRQPAIAASPASRLWILLSFVALMLASASARAIPPPLPSVSRTLPANGQLHPANAAIVLVGGQALYDGRATIDGAPARLVTAANLPVVAGALLVRVEPEPRPGAHVEVTGKFCEALYGCTASVSYVAGPRDTTPPAPVDGVFFDVDDGLLEGHRPQDPPFRRTDWFVSVLQRASADESPRVFHVEGSRPTMPGSAGVTRTTLAIGAPLPLQFPTELSSTQDAAEAACFRVSVIDTAGNRSAPVEQCSACRARRAEHAFGAKRSWSPMGLFDVHDISACPDGTRSIGQTLGLATTVVVVLVAALAVRRHRQRRSLFLP